MFQLFRSLFSSLQTPQSLADQRFGPGAARRVAIAIDNEVSRLGSYRGHIDIFLFDVMPTDGRSGSLAIESYATEAVEAGLPGPEIVHAELLAATFRRIADELGYTGRIGISFTNYIQGDGYPFRLRGFTVRSIDDGSLSVFAIAA